MITKERIELIANFHRAMTLPPSHDEIEELARIALAAMDSDPVRWLSIYHGEVYDEAIGITRSAVEAQADRFGWEYGLTEIIPLYRHAQPASVVPPALPENDDEDGNDIDYLEPSAVYDLGRTAGWNACRAAMLQAGNSPVIPDGYVMVPKEPTKEMIDAGWLHFMGTKNPSSKGTYEAMLAAAPREVPDGK